MVIFEIIRFDLVDWIFFKLTDGMTKCPARFKRHLISSFKVNAITCYTIKMTSPHVTISKKIIKRILIMRTEL